MQWPYQVEKLVCVLTPTKDKSNTMAQYVLNDLGKVVLRRSIQPLKTEEMYSETEKRKRSEFDKIIEEKLGNSLRIPDRRIDDIGQKLNDEDFIDDFCVQSKRPMVPVLETSGMSKRYVYVCYYVVSRCIMWSISRS